MYRSFIVNRVYRKNFSSCCCKMCNSEIPLNVNTIIYHLESTEIHRQHFHKIQLDQELERLPEDLSYYLFDNGITYNGNSKYICHSCNSSIFGINTVRRHIGGYLHSKILDSKVNLYHFINYHSSEFVHICFLFYLIEISRNS